MNIIIIFFQVRMKFQVRIESVFRAFSGTKLLNLGVKFPKNFA